MTDFERAKIEAAARDWVAAENRLHDARRQSDPGQWTDASVARTQAERAFLDTVRRAGCHGRKAEAGSVRTHESSPPTFDAHRAEQAERRIAFLESQSEAALENSGQLEGRLRATLKDAAALVKALRDIEKGEGAFSRDPLTHAENCIDAMKQTAKTALAQLEAPR